MRIWDIDPGYLNRQSLLAEHQELHGLLSVIKKNNPRFANRPETSRWKPYLEALCCRHDWLVAEMTLRGFRHKSPLENVAADPQWPADFLIEPFEQYRELTARYEGKEPGRIPFPTKAHQLWAQHKYSVMARDPGLSTEIGRGVASGHWNLESLTEKLVSVLRMAPLPGRLLNALEHMWGYVSEFSELRREQLESANALLTETRNLVMKHRVLYLQEATALGELGRFTS